jgi:hypothetical protein
MATYKVAVDGRLRPVVSKYTRAVPAALYAISRKLQVVANVCRQRVKHVQDGHERVARENGSSGYAPARVDVAVAGFCRLSRQFMTRSTAKA